MINHKIAATNKPRIVIAGGGFAGVELAKILAKEDVQVVLIDKQNYHTFQPLLYQVATAGLEPASIIYPFRKIFESCHNVYFRMAEVLSVNAIDRMVETSIGIFHYDYLVIATGAVTNFYGNQQIQEKAIPIKNIDEALSLRNTILSNFEKALQLDDEQQIESLMDYVIVGGGPTGVEIAGALSELKRHVFPKDYKELDFLRMDIHLIQSGHQLLKGMSEKASQASLENLQDLGVKVWLNRRVKSYDGFTVELDSGEKLFTRTMIWAAGVTGAPLRGIRPESMIMGNRLKVNQYSLVEGYENIYAIGDIAVMVSEEFPGGHPMMAQPAMQQGKWLGDNLLRILGNKPVRPFV